MIRLFAVFTSLVSLTACQDDPSISFRAELPVTGSLVYDD